MLRGWDLWISFTSRNFASSLACKEAGSLFGPFETRAAGKDNSTSGEWKSRGRGQKPGLRRYGVTLDDKASGDLDPQDPQCQEYGNGRLI